MGAYKNFITDLTSCMAYNIVDYGLAERFEGMYKWRELEEMAFNYLQNKHPEYIELYEDIHNSGRYNEKEKHNLASALFMGIAQEIDEDDIKDYFNKNTYCNNVLLKAV